MRVPLRNKITTLAVAAALLPVLVTVAVTLTEERHVSQVISHEIDNMAQETITHVALDLYNLCDTTNTFVEEFVAQAAKGTQKIVAESKGFAMEDLTKRIADWEPGEESSQEEPDEVTAVQADVSVAPEISPEPVPAPASPAASPAASPVAQAKPVAPAPQPAPVNLADASLLDLFVIEAQTHGQSLDTGLVELEKDQRPELVEPLMPSRLIQKETARADRSACRDLRNTRKMDSPSTAPKTSR